MWDVIAIYIHRYIKFELEREKGTKNRVTLGRSFFCQGRDLCLRSLVKCCEIESDCAVLKKRTDMHSDS